MMKRRLTVLLAALLALCFGAAIAQERCTLSQLRVQASSGWQETYMDRYGRRIAVDIDVEVFGAEAAPVVKVKPSRLEIDCALLEDGAVFTDRTLYRNNPADDIFGARSGQVTMDVHHTYGEKIDMDAVYGGDSARS